MKEHDDAAKSVFSDMLKMCGANDTRDLTSDLFNKHSVSKAQLAEWLTLAVYPAGSNGAAVAGESRQATAAAAGSSQTRGLCQAAACWERVAVGCGGCVAVA